MLTGRESLKRLIGKRRRFLPNRESIFPCPLPQSSLNLLKKEEDDEVCEAHQPPKLNLIKNGDSEWVNCPICGVQVRSDDGVINSHLDACLARGSKRKLSQQTLFQFDFCSRSKVKSQPIESNCGGIADIVHCNGGDSGICNADDKLDQMKGFDECTRNKLEGPLNCIVTESNKSDGYVENHAGDEEINDGVDSLSLPPEGMMSKLDVEECIGDDGLSGMSLQTFIVGRRFADQMELNSETKILLSRDPDNVKDPNAIKVLSADGGICKVVGFLPRELSQYLSPLMDKFHLSFEGHVTSVPKHLLAVVPIQIVCQNQLFQGNENCESLNLFKSLWKHAVHVVDSSKAQSPGMTRYQQNLALLIKEVLQTNSHILTDGEKTFLERLTLLSDDSQRLFARLYTRKGPWFRMSTISYTEILDLERAVKELSEAGYICSLASEKDIQDNDLQEMLNVLNVAELREMTNILINEV